jgi:hypothetical protein
MSTELTRKDRLAANIRWLQSIHGGNERGGDLDIIPETYILPEQLSEFKDAFNKQTAFNQSVH